jgi:hypothetical protein
LVINCIVACERVRGGGESPYSRVQLQIIPKTHKPWLEDVSSLRRGEVALHLVEVVFSSVPIRPWFQLESDKGRSGSNGRVAGIERVIEGFQSTRIAEEDPEPGGGRGRCGCGGVVVTGGRVWIRTFIDGKVITFSVDGNPRKLERKGCTNSAAPMSR